MKHFRGGILIGIIMLSSVSIMTLSFYIARGQTNTHQPDCAADGSAYPIPRCRGSMPTEPVQIEEKRTAQAARVIEKSTEEARAVAYGLTEVARPHPTITQITEEQLAHATTFVPGSVPDAAQTVKPLDPTEANTPFERYANSIWQIGGLPSSSPYDYITIVVLARPARSGKPAEISIVPLSNSLTQKEWKQYFKVWQLPASIDRITITGFDKLVVKVQDISGILHFTTSEEGTGDLNLASGDITISGTPVALTPVAP
jgi:hypothetical protein